jgi:hypothetical protein
MIARPLVSTADLCAWIWPRGAIAELARLAIAVGAVPVRRGGGRGRPWLWRLRDDA